MKGKKMSKWKCEKCDPYDPCYYYCGRTGTEPVACPITDNKPYWVPIKRELFGKTEQLPKLTEEVFNRPDCPVWAKIAVVNQDGSASWGSGDKASPVGGAWMLQRATKGFQWKPIPGKFDASDWENSLVRRPVIEALPEWCKQDAWIFDCNEREYAQVKDITGEIEDVDLVYAGTEERETKSRKYIIDCCLEARLRPFNADEMKALVGKVIEHKKDLHLVTNYLNDTADNEPFVCVGTNWREAKGLIEHNYTIDGTPCGVFEHLEDGEWCDD
jgi:hypothetical protein